MISPQAKKQPLIVYKLKIRVQPHGRSHDKINGSYIIMLSKELAKFCGSIQNLVNPMTNHHPTSAFDDL